jgi:hypothetical protein
MSEIPGQSGHALPGLQQPVCANSGQCLDPSYYAAGCPTAGSIHQEPASQPLRRFGYGLNVQHSQRSVSTPRASVRFVVNTIRFDGYESHRSIRVTHL